VFRRNTVFVVGAGASHEFGLPLGRGLANQIAGKLNFGFERQMSLTRGDPDLYHVLSKHAAAKKEDRNIYWRAGQKIAQGINLAYSIDDFIDSHAHDKAIELCGKLAIAQTILEAERASTLMQDNQQEHPDFEALENTWIVAFMRMLRERVPRTAIERLFDNVAFVVFNYDRCIEQFLVHAVQLAYGLTLVEAIDVCDNLVIVHAYGQTGRLRFNPRLREDVAFGDAAAPLLKLTERIRTYSEQIEDQAELDPIRLLIGSAEVLVFLGFAFHEQNMLLLKPKPKGRAQHVYATTMGICEPDIQVVRNRLRPLMYKDVASIDARYNLYAGSSAAFFREYQRRLTDG
jgi:hypothetical protein